ncbi:MAG: leucine-rich repeat domain-containing protein [Promethearchaeota archaeon]
MLELSPKKIFDNYKRKEVNKDFAEQQLISIIENSDNVSIRLESLKFLGKIHSKSNNVFRLLENLFISDLYEQVRISAAVLLKENYLIKALTPMRWALEHEDSREILSIVFKSLLDIISYIESIKNKDAEDILLNEVQKIKEKNFSICFERIHRNNSEKKLSCGLLSDILRNYFTLIYLRKTFWRLKYSIENCMITKLSFKFKGLTRIPNAIKYLNSLKILKCRYNQIVELPEWIGNLSNLEVLNLNMNTLNRIPESIGNLKMLKILSLWKNELLKLPKNITKLKLLESLILRINHIIELPENIGDLTNLKVLDLHDNNLESIPETIGNLINLENLNLSWNEIKTLPESIKNLKSLRILDLGGNKIEDLPEYIGNLNKLEYLNISRNNISKLPKSLINLNKLKEIYISENNISKNDKILRELKEKNVKIY